jgi:hypothetical protein
LCAYYSTGTDQPDENRLLDRSRTGEPWSKGARSLYFSRYFFQHVKDLIFSD